MKNTRKVILTADKHSDLMRAILDDFAPFFVPGGEPIYVGGSGAEEEYSDQEVLTSFGVTIGQPEKMPDVVLYGQRRTGLS